GDAVLRAAIRGKFPFEPGDFLAQHKLAALENPEDGRVDFSLDTGVLGLEIEKRNHTELFVSASSTTRACPAIDSVAASGVRTTRGPAWPSVHGIVCSSMQTAQYDA